RQARSPTAHLARSLLCLEGGEQETARDALLPGAPLRRFRLLDFADAVPGVPQSLRPLRIDDRIADYLRGINRLDDSVVHLLRPVPAAPLPGVHRELVDGLLRWAQTAVASEPWPLFQLTGPADAGQQTVAREFCTGLGLQLYALDARRLPVQE